MKAGDIVLVKFPFASLETAKKRPALILHTLRHSAGLHLATLAMITSQVDGLKLKGDVLLAEWEKASLLHPSLVRLGKIATVDAALIEKTLGHLAPKDFRQLKSTFRLLFAAWV